jgi:hypothetical protein
VVPGEHAVDFSFRFPYRGDRVSYRHSFFQGSDVYQVLVPERMTSIQVAPLEQAPTVDIEGSRYRVWEGRDFRSGQNMVLELTNLPEPSLAARFGKLVTDGSFWRVAIPGAAGAALAFLLLLGMTRASRKAVASVAATPEELNTESPQRVAMIREVAVLDERFQQGTLPEAEYRRRRDGLRARILRIPQPAGGERETPPGELEH